MKEIHYYQNEIMNERCLINKSSFNRLIREIAREMTTKDVEHRFDILMTLQMTIEHIIIMIFELIYNIHHSNIINYKNKFVIHVKYVIIQFKNMSLLSKF